MKKLLALTLCLLLLAGCAAPAVYDGPTQSAWVLTEMFTTYSGGDTARTVHAYDSYGNQVHTKSYSNDDLEREYQYRYDDRGNLVSSVSWDHTGLFSFLPWNRVRYTYDDQNRLLTTIYRNGFFLKTGSNAYTYDDEANTVYWEGTNNTQTTYLNENGDPIRVVTYSAPAGTEIETLYEYDELGRNTKTVDYSNGICSSTMEERWDDRDRILERSFYDTDGTVFSRTTYEYTENTVTTQDLDGYKTVEHLRPDGQLEKREQFYPSGELRAVTEYTYTEIQIPAKEE